MLAAPPDPKFPPPCEPVVGLKPKSPADEPEALATEPLCCGEAMKLIPEELPEPPCPLLSELGVIVTLPLFWSAAEPLLGEPAYVPLAPGAVSVVSDAALAVGRGAVTFNASAFVPPTTGVVSVVSDAALAVGRGAVTFNASAFVVMHVSLGRLCA
jgi:hypothetical protein